PEDHLHPAVSEVQRNPVRSLPPLLLPFHRHHQASGYPGSLLPEHAVSFLHKSSGHLSEFFSFPPEIPLPEGPDAFPDKWKYLPPSILPPHASLLTLPSFHRKPSL